MLGIRSGGWRRFPHNGVRYRSKWEVEVAKIFDGCGVPFEYERRDAGTRTYPDFYVPALDRYLEVHPDYHGEKTVLPPNCVVTKTLSHSRAAAIAMSLAVNRTGVASFTRGLSKQALRGFDKIALDLAVYLKQAIVERDATVKP